MFGSIKHFKVEFSIHNDYKIVSYTFLSYKVLTTAISGGKLCGWSGQGWSGDGCIHPKAQLQQEREIYYKHKRNYEPP
jgi:hypothetical protein